MMKHHLKMRAQCVFRPSVSAGLRGWEFLRKSPTTPSPSWYLLYLNVCTPYTFLKPFAQKIIKEGRIPHDHTVIVYSTSTGAFPWESNRPPSHRQVENEAYWGYWRGWPEEESRKTLGFLCSASSEITASKVRGYCTQHWNHRQYWEPHGKGKADHAADTMQSLRGFSKQWQATRTRSTLEELWKSAWCYACFPSCL